MLAVTQPIGHFVALAHLDANFLPQANLGQKIRRLVRNIQEGLKQAPLSELAVRFTGPLFELRLALLPWLSQEKKLAQNLSEELMLKLSQHWQLAPYSDLAADLATCLSVYEEILSANAASLDQAAQQLDSAKAKALSYDMLNELSLHPSAQIRYLKHWVDASLQLEFSLIVSELLLYKQLSLAETTIRNELQALLYQSLNRFGAYAIFTGFWQAPQNSTDPIINRMRILAATLELEHQKPQAMSPTDFMASLNL